MKRLVFIAVSVETPGGPACRPRLLWALTGLYLRSVRPSDPPHYPVPALLLRAGVHHALPERSAWLKGGRELLAGAVVTDWLTSLQSP